MSIIYHPQPRIPIFSGHLEIHDTHPYLLTFGDPAAQSLTLRVPERGFAAVILGLRAAIIVPIPALPLTASNYNVFHSFVRRIWGVMSVIANDLPHCFPVSEPLVTLVLSRWNLLTIHNYVGEAQRIIRYHRYQNSMHWIEIPLLATHNAGIARLVVGQQNGAVNVRITGDTWPLSVFSGFAAPAGIWQPSLTMAPIMQLREVAAIIPSPGGVYQMPLPPRAHIGPLASNNAAGIDDVDSAQMSIDSPDLYSSERSLPSSAPPEPPSRSQSLPPPKRRPMTGDEAYV